MARRFCRSAMCPFRLRRAHREFFWEQWTVRLDEVLEECRRLLRDHRFHQTEVHMAQTSPYEKQRIRPLLCLTDTRLE